MSLGVTLRIRPPITACKCYCEIVMQDILTHIYLYKLYIDESFLKLLQSRAVSVFFSFFCCLINVMDTHSSRLCCCHFKTWCTDPIYWYTSNILPAVYIHIANTVYVNTRQNKHIDIVWSVFGHSGTIRCERQLNWLPLHCLRRGFLYLCFWSAAQPNFFFTSSHFFKLTHRSAFVFLPHDYFFLYVLWDIKQV